VLAAIALAVGAAAPRDDDPVALLHQGHAAFARGDYAAAAELYDRASLRAEDPAEATLCLAAAKYHLAPASGGSSRELREAETLFRCVLPDPERRARALLGLGNCLLARGGRDSEALRSAVECFGQCARESEGALREDARHNRERARLLLAQTAPEGRKPPDERPSPNDPNEPPPDPQRPPPGSNPADADPAAGGRPDDPAGPAKPEPGTAPRAAETTPPPGAGNLPPIPDAADVKALSARDAAEHLDRAHRLITAERRSHRRAVSRVPAEGIPAW
jgi:tetratricopeptide (TPR) repeat protein